MFHSAKYLILLALIGVYTSEFSLRVSGKSTRKIDKKLTLNSKFKIRKPRKINVLQKDNPFLDLGDDVVVYSDQNRVEEFKDFKPTNDFFITLSNVYERLMDKVNSLHLRVAAVEDRADAISHRLDYLDCYDYKLDNPAAFSGVYGFHLDVKGKRLVEVTCDMLTDGGGWTVIQQRLARETVTNNDTSNHHRTEFLRGYRDYKVGFGSPQNDYWLGLENIYLLTNSRQYELRIHLTDFSGQEAFAHYMQFHIENEEEGYRLHVSGYKGNAGDSMSTDESFDNFTADGMKFSTFDHDQDKSVEVNCAAFWGIGGWWYNKCSWANLNGPYNVPEKNEDCVGVNWHKWRNKKCLKATKMMIRPAIRLA